MLKEIFWSFVILLIFWAESYVLVIKNGSFIYVLTFEDNHLCRLCVVLGTLQSAYSLKHMTLRQLDYLDRLGHYSSSIELNEDGYRN